MSSLMLFAASCAFDVRPALQPGGTATLLRLHGGFAEPGISGAARQTLSSASNMVSGASTMKLAMGTVGVACLMLLLKLVRAWLVFYMQGKKASAGAFADRGVEPLPWGRLQQLLAQGAADSVEGAASGFAGVAREEAASKLISNHNRVLADMTNAFPITQCELARLALGSRHYADQALRETAKRLLGRRDEDGESMLAPTTTAQAEAWKGACAYLDGRIQARREECSGRAPDMSEQAASAMRAVLREVGVGVVGAAGRGVAVAP